MNTPYNGEEQRGMTTATPTVESMTSDLDDLLTGPVVRDRRGSQCTIGALLDALDVESPELAAKLRKAIDSPRVTAAALSELFAKYGEDIQPYTVRRHRNRGLVNGKGKCRCPR